jgi:hypothetical protein
MAQVKATSFPTKIWPGNIRCLGELKRSSTVEAPFKIGGNLQTPHRFRREQRLRLQSP